MLVLVAILTSVAFSASTVKGSATGEAAGLSTDSGTYTVSNPYGPITITCKAGTTASASVTWSLDGDAAILTTVKKGMGADVKKVGTGATIAPLAPKEISTLTTKDVTLVVTLPAGGTYNVVGGEGDVSVKGCKGTADVRNTKGGLAIEGSLTTLKANAPNGDVTAILRSGTLSAASSIDAAVGNIHMEMPEFSAGVTAAASNIHMEMPEFKTTSEAAGSLIGAMGKGGAMLMLNAPKGTINLK
jgi:hypothetical protein